MNHRDKNNTIPLTGADCFILALEKRDPANGTSGNTCRYMMELEGRLDAELFKNKINSNKELLRLASFYTSKRGPFTKPVWKTAPGISIGIDTHESDDFLPVAISEKKFPAGQPGLFAFDIIYRSNGNCCVVLSWNHTIMDGHGAVLLLKQINAGKEIELVAHAPKIKFNYKSVGEAAKAKFFIGRSKKNALSGLSPVVKPGRVNQCIRTVRFTKEETMLAHKNGLASGAVFGPSPYLLACCAMAVKAVLAQRKTPVANFWVPVPKNKRKKGVSGPVLGNHLTFLFYLISDQALNSIKDCVKALNDQMAAQVRDEVPTAYDMLMHYLKRIPYPLYRHYTRGPNGGSLSSFLFTMAEDHPAELALFEGHKVLDAHSFPPNIYPPGLTFAFMRSNGCLQLMMLYYEEVLTGQEADKIEQVIRSAMHGIERY